MVGTVIRKTPSQYLAEASKNKLFGDWCYLKIDNKILVVNMVQLFKHIFHSKKDIKTMKRICDTLLERMK